MLPKRVARPGLAAGGRAATMVAVANRPQPHFTTIFAQGRPVGHVDTRTGIFHKKCRASVHMLRKPLGWALDISSLAEAEQAGATLVQIEDTESGRAYSTSIERIRQDGIPLDRGYGEQLLLPLSGWTIRDSRQLSLWGAA